jgi:radical SAM protein with 4Fe4S-binding SPASM domain
MPIVLFQNPNVEVVFGPVNSAIYDFGRNKVFWVNQTGTQVLRTIERSKNEIEKSLFVSSLLGMGFYSQSPFQETNTNESRSNPYDFIWLEVTRECNLFCQHCYADAGFDYDGIPSKIEFWQRVLSEFRRVGFSAVQLIGGEPHLCEDLVVEIVESANSMRFGFIEVFSNLTLLSERLIECYRDNNVTVAFSIYGHTSGAHDSVTGSPGSFKATMKNLLKLCDEGVKTRPALIAMPSNIGQIQDTAKFLRRLGYSCNGHESIRPIGRGAQLVSLQSDFWDRCRFHAPQFSTNRSLFERAQRFNSCWAGKLLITSEGDVFPCVMGREESIGNIKIDSVDAVLCSARSNRFWGLAVDQIEICSSCEFRYACLDCRPLAIALTGRTNGKNPRCSYNPATGIWEGDYDEETAGIC